MEVMEQWIEKLKNGGFDKAYGSWEHPFKRESYCAMGVLRVVMKSDKWVEDFPEPVSVSTLKEMYPFEQYYDEEYETVVQLNDRTSLSLRQIGFLVERVAKLNPEWRL